MINEERKTIDSLDTEIVKLFEQRLNAVSYIAQYKKSHGLDIRDVSREIEVIKKVQQHLIDPNYAPYVAQLFESIMKISCDFQNQLIQKD